MSTSDSGVDVLLFDSLLESEVLISRDATLQAIGNSAGDQLITEYLMLIINKTLTFLRYLMSCYFSRLIRNNYSNNSIKLRYLTRERS